MTFTVVAYDIRDNRRRARVARILQDVAERVQASVFEGYIDPATLDRTVRRLEACIDHAKDSVRIYRICATCLRQVRTLGIGQIAEDEQTIVI